MYINFPNLSSHHLGDIEKLTAIKQRETAFLQQHLTEDDISRFKQLNYLTEVKPKTKQEHPLERIRLSKEGSKYLTDLSFAGSADEQTKILLEWLVGLYKKKKGGIIKNKTEIARRIQWFRKITNIEGNHLATLLSCFIQDSFIPENPKNFSIEFSEFKEGNPRAVINNMLDNLFYAPESMFDKHYTLDKSPLFRYYEDNLEYVREVWRKNNLEVV